MAWELSKGSGGLTVKLAPGYRREQEYVIDVLLGEFLGLDYQVDGSPNPSPVVTISGAGRSLRLPQQLFRGDDSEGLAGRYSPPRCRTADAGLPPAGFGGRPLVLLYGLPDQDGTWLKTAGDMLTLHADVLGSSFFVLTRLEEIGAAERDIYGIFPPRATLAGKKGFLTRPVVDEYTSLLWCAMQRLWPRLRSRSRHFAVRVSHDVDRPRAFDHRSLRDRLWVVRYHARKGTLPALAGSRTLNALAAVVRLPP